MGNEIPVEIQNKIDTAAQQYESATQHEGLGSTIFKAGVDFVMAYFKATSAVKTEAAIEEALHKERNAIQAKMTEMETGYLKQMQCMADALEKIVSVPASSPETSWAEIAREMKRIANAALQQFKDGKGKEVGDA